VQSRKKWKPDSGPQKSSADVPSTLRAVSLCGALDRRPVRGPRGGLAGE
jgi:hypothetical protein